MSNKTKGIKTSNIITGNDLNIASAGNISNSGEISANNTIGITSNADISNFGNIIAQ